MEESIEEDITQGSHGRAAIIFVGALLTFFSYLPLSWMMGLSSFDVRPLSLSIFGYFFVAWLGCHIVLVSPISKLVYPQMNTHMRAEGAMSKRYLLVLGLLLPPVLSFVYFRGGLSSLMDLHEALLVVVPAVILGLLSFERHHRDVWFSLILAAGVYVPLFVINDILSSIDTQASYLSRSASFYLLRVALPVLLTIGILAWENRGVTKTIKSSLTNYVFVFLAIGLYGLFVHVLLPLAYSIRQGEAVTSLANIEVWWIGYLLAVFFLARPSRIGFGCLAALALLNVGIVVVRLALYFGALDVTLWRLWWFSTQLVVLGSSVWLGSFLLKKETRARFLVQQA